MSKRLLELALEFAHLGRQDERNFRLAALAVRRDGVIVISHNGPAKMPMPSAHAEARVLRKAGLGATLYVARARADGSPANAMPCEYCQALIRAKRVERVYWTF